MVQFISILEYIHVCTVYKWSITEVQFISVLEDIHNCTVDLSIIAHLLMYQNVSVIAQSISVHKHGLDHTAHQCSFITQVIRSISQFLSVFIFPSFMSNKFVYVNYCLYLKLECIFQIRNILFTGSCYHIWEVENVTEVHVLRCVIWNEV